MSEWVIYWAVMLVLLTNCCGTMSKGQDASHLESSTLFTEVMGSSTTLKGIAAEPHRYRVQIIFSEIVEGQLGRPVLKRFTYRENSEYWYPASTIKLTTAAAALEVLQSYSLRHKFLTVDTPMVIHPLVDGEQLRESDPTDPDRALTVRNEIRKSIIVSDNPAFNNLYDFVGQAPLNQRMRAAGLSNPILVHRLAISRTAEQNRTTPTVEFRDGPSTLTLNGRRNTQMVDTSWLNSLAGAPDHYLGRGVQIRRGEIVPGPMRMSDKNAIPLRDLQNLTAMIVRPDIALGLPGFVLTDEHRQLLIDAMTELPSQSTSPRFDPEQYSDEYPHFFRKGIARVVPVGELKISNKIGLAYGFSSETAYIEHVPSGRAFFLAMTIYTNDNAILNDNDYEYDLAHAAMQDVAEVLARRVFQPEPLRHSAAQHNATVPSPTPWRHESHSILGTASLPLTIKQGSDWTSEPIELKTACIEALLSWNADLPDGVRLDFAVRVRADEHQPWSDFLHIGEAGEYHAQAPWNTQADVASVDVDTLIPSKPVRWVQIQVASPADPTGTQLASRIHRLDLLTTASVTSGSRVPDERLAGRIEVPTPFLPNDIDDEALKSRLCSPLSLRMLLAQRGVELPIRTVAQAVYDTRFDIYGNWSNAIQAAHQLGVPGHLHRFSDWSQVRQHLLDVGPFALSLRAAEGELSNAPYSSTIGHLIVLYGLDENGDALVIDPAVTEEAQARRTYTRDELTQVWMNRVKGLAYVLLPPEQVEQPQ